MENTTTIDVMLDAVLIPFVRNYPALIGRLVFSVLLSILIVCSNGVVMATYLLVDDIRKDLTNRFIVNLSTADLMTGLINVPFLADADFSVHWRFGEVFCKIRQAWSYVITFVPVTVIILMTIFHNMRTSRNPKLRYAIQAKHIDVAMAICWIGESAFDFFLAFGFPAIYRKSLINYESSCHMEFIFLSPNFVICIIIFRYAFPLAILSCISLHLFFAIRNISNRIHIAENTPEAVGISSTRANTATRTSGLHMHMHMQSIPMPVVSEDGARRRSSKIPANAGSSCSDHPGTPKTSDVNRRRALAPSDADRPRSQGRRVKQASAPVIPKKNKLYGHRKSAVMLSILVGALLVFWTPVAITSLVFLACGDCISPITFYWTYMVIYLNSLVNPFLYAVTNRQYRKGFAKVLRFCSGRCPNSLS